jgi:hypothetical protein
MEPDHNGDNACSGRAPLQLLKGITAKVFVIIAWERFRQATTQKLCCPWQSRCGAARAVCTVRISYGNCPDVVCRVLGVGRAFCDRISECSTDSG